MNLNHPELLSVLRQAIKLGDKAAQSGDVPIGALVIDENGQIIGRGYNLREGQHDPTGHAEIVALREAGKTRGNWRLEGCTLVVTLEPCAMCAGAAVLARVKRIIFGAWDPKAGACGSLRDIVRDTRLNHNPEVIGGVCEKECEAQLQKYFSAHR
ncbi:tRNA adenosine(34) deaminase TadA [Actinomycetaceae bacterium TAE3-ERU4]|nr:tRNA adenosine(34) deaminase TadA [Actinomycetaceae bacterium TAE3-ERU4]